ncbi:hypothetical protein JCM11641_004912 [Rhodosporidiobolus odoratus]
MDTVPPPWPWNNNDYRRAVYVAFIEPANEKTRLAQQQPDGSAVRSLALDQAKWLMLRAERLEEFLPDEEWARLLSHRQSSMWKLVLERITEAGRAIQRGRTPQEVNQILRGAMTTPNGDRYRSQARSKLWHAPYPTDSSSSSDRPDAAAPPRPIFRRRGRPWREFAPRAFPSLTTGVPPPSFRQGDRQAFTFKQLEESIRSLEQVAGAETGRREELVERVKQYAEHIVVTAGHWDSLTLGQRVLITRNLIRSYEGLVYRHALPTWQQIMTGQVPCTIPTLVRPELFFAVFVPKGRTVRRLKRSPTQHQSRNASHPETSDDTVLSSPAQSLPPGAATLLPPNYQPHPLVDPVLLATTTSTYSPVPVLHNLNYSDAPSRVAAPNDTEADLPKPYFCLREAQTRARDGFSLARDHRRIGLRTAARLGTTCEAFQAGTAFK